MSVQKLKTNKLFFNKWPYRVECTLPGAWAASGNRLTDKIFAEWLDQNDALLPRYSWRAKLDLINKPLVKELRQAINLFRDREIKVRGEGVHLNIYCKDDKTFIEISIALEKWITKVWEPDNDTELDFFVNGTARTVLCDKFPYGIYNYKVVINNKTDFDTRNKFYEWSKKYPDSILISKSTIHWMTGLTSFTSAPFIYVVDSKMLMMAALYLGYNVKYIEEFILRKSINTP